MEQKFYICKHCGNIIAKVKDTGVPVICCGELLCRRMVWMAILSATLMP